MREKNWIQTLLLPFSWSRVGRARQGKSSILNQRLQENSFLKDGGDGYPSESYVLESKRLEASVTGDGGLSWRLKALRRAKEQAEREGKKLDMVSRGCS
ncbi:hypothetical protein L7F22_036009 [Adiantum nelumboides]|nr:hypothetical protein [Adiantum nelumboides]